MYVFLTGHPVKLNQEELEDIQRRKDMDEKRIEEQRRFYEIARERARELDIYMERFRRDIVESSMSYILFIEVDADAIQTDLRNYSRRSKRKKELPT